MTSVSIITISQYSRFECLKNLYELIKLQDYPFIKEWIIIEGSKTNELKQNSIIQINKFIQEIKEKTDFEIRYIIPKYILPISDLRNFGNNTCHGEIIVCMDDDDYYPKERVSHAVEKLKESGLKIAGCSPVYMYEYYYQKLYKFDGYMNHSTNNCMAFTKEYLKNHQHKDGLSVAEESSFTNNFREPMVQLDPLKCIIVSSHNYNTFDKKQLIEAMETDQRHDIFEINKPITDYIPKDIFFRMGKIFSNCRKEFPI